MKKNYFIHGLLFASSLTLLSGCSHLSISQSKNNNQPIPQKNSKNIVVATQSVSTVTKSKEAQSNVQSNKNIKISEQNLESSTYANVFENLTDNNHLVEFRKDLLTSLSKPGENIYKDLADRKERKRKGITLPGERSGILEMSEYRRNITMPIGSDKMLYKDGFLEKEYEKAVKSPILAKAKSSRYKSAKAGSYSLANVVWTERGPNNIPGRGRSIVPSPTNPNKWYNGTAGGGVWITDNAGVSWRNTTDYAIPNLATSTIAISQSNANVIYAGTGEPFGNSDGITGSGIVKSLDAGETWSYLSNTNSFGSVGRLLANPTNDAQVFAGTSKGIYQTNDGGTSWTKIYNGSGTYTNVQDLKATADFSTIYGSVNSYGVIKSTDGGASWSQVFDVAGKSIKRIELAISPADNNTLYLSTESGSTTGLYRSGDAGATFVVQNYLSGDSKEILGAQGWYDNIIAAHPTNKNIVYVGGISVAKITVDQVANKYTVLSIASGYDNSKLNSYVHPDQHGLYFQTDPSDPSKFRMLLNNDGGIYYTNYKTNPGETQNDFISSAKGLNNTQFYGADKKKDEDSYIAGAQDNGSSATLTSPSTAASSYLSLFGGDGFEVLWNYNNTQKLLFGSQYNNFITSRSGVQNTSLYYARNADNGSAKSPFYSKLANANNNPDVVFTVSSTGVWRSLDFGANWTVTPFNTATNGSWLGAGTAATVKVSVANPDVVWAATAVSGGNGTTYKVNVSKDNGTTFAKTTGTVPISGNYYMSGLAASSVNPAQAYTLFSVANQAKVVKTSDYGATWTDITGFSTGTPTGFPNVPVHSLIEMPFDTNILWAGTDVGIFETVDGGANWYIVTAFPPISVWSMKIVDDQVVLATHGRGVWTATIPELSSYVLPEYISAPVVKSARQTGIHNMSASAVFNYVSPQITDLKVFVDNAYVSTISGTVPNTDYNFTSSILTEGNHIISVQGIYGGTNETVKSPKTVEIINFNSGEEKVTISDFTASDVYIGTDGKFVVDNVDSKFTYNVLNNVGHPYAVNSTFQTYLRTPIIIGADSKQSIKHMVFTEATYDFGIVEASKDLVNWVVVGKYDENSFAEWNGISTAGAVTEDKFKWTTLDFPAKFTTGEEVAVRLRMTSDPAEVRFGWIVKEFIPTSKLLATGEKSVEKSDIFLAPNPTSESTDLYLPSNLKGNVEIGIYDAAGKLVKNLSKAASSKINIDVSAFDTGIYLVLVKTESGNKALKLMKK